MIDDRKNRMVVNYFNRSTKRVVTIVTTAVTITANQDTANREQRGVLTSVLLSKVVFKSRGARDRGGRARTVNVTRTKRTSIGHF